MPDVTAIAVPQDPGQNGQTTVVSQIEEPNKAPNHEEADNKTTEVEITQKDEKIADELAQMLVKDAGNSHADLIQLANTDLPQNQAQPTAEQNEVNPASQDIHTPAQEAYMPALAQPGSQTTINTGADNAKSGDPAPANDLLLSVEELGPLGLAPGVGLDTKTNTRTNMGTVGPQTQTGTPLLDTEIPVDTTAPISQQAPEEPSIISQPGSVNNARNNETISSDSLINPPSVPDGFGQKGSNPDHEIQNQFTQRVKKIVTGSLDLAALGVTNNSEAGRKIIDIYSKNPDQYNTLIHALATIKDIGGQSTTQSLIESTRDSIKQQITQAQSAGQSNRISTLKQAQELLDALGEMTLQNSSEIPTA